MKFIYCHGCNRMHDESIEYISDPKCKTANGRAATFCVPCYPLESDGKYKGKEDKKKRPEIPKSKCQLKADDMSNIAVIGRDTLLELEASGTVDLKERVVRGEGDFEIEVFEPSE